MSAQRIALLKTRISETEDAIHRLSIDSIDKYKLPDGTEVNKIDINKLREYKDSLISEVNQLTGPDYLIGVIK